MTTILFPPLALGREQAERGVHALLQDHGYRLQPAFDLACADLHEGRRPCPHHQEGACTCHLVTWLVYNAAGRLAGVLVLHGHDQRTRLRWKPAAPRGSDPVGQMLARWTRRHIRAQVPPVVGGASCP